MAEMASMVGCFLTYPLRSLEVWFAGRQLGPAVGGTE